MNEPSKIEQAWEDVQAAAPNQRLPEPLQVFFEMLVSELVALRDENQQLCEDVALLKQQLAQQVTAQRIPPRLFTPEVRPPMQRSMEYWVAHVPDFGDDLSAEEIQQHLSQPILRVKDLPAEPLPPPAAPAHSNQRYLSTVILLLALIGCILLLLGMLIRFW